MHNSLRKASQSFNGIFEEIPITIKNPQLVRAWLLEYKDDDALFDKGREFDRLDLGTNSFLEMNVEFLIDSVDKLTSEQNDFQRHVYKTQTAMQKKVCYSSLQSF